MKLQIWGQLILTNIIATSQVWAACPAPKTADDVIRCAIEESPETQRVKGEVSESKASVEAAGQIPNPEFGADYFGRNSESELSLSLQIPMSGLLNRGAKKKSAEALSAAALAQQISTQSRVKIETIVNLHRLRQLYREVELISEALGTFEKLVKQYRGRTQLAPEQEVSLSVFQMAESDYRLQKATLGEEEADLARFFALATGFDLKQIRSVLPAPISIWPEIASSPLENSQNSDPVLLVARAELARTDAELSLAKSSNWSEIKLGPLMKRTQTGRENSTTWGAGISLPLPLFNLNGGERRRAAVAKSNAELNVALATNESAQLSKKLTQSYLSNVQTLQGALSLTLLNKNHDRIEKLFLRGIVSSALVIEAHRQLLDLEKSRNEKERLAIESLWSLKALNGRIMEESL